MSSPEDSGDSSDEDYMPNSKVEDAVSEVDSDGDSEDQLSEDDTPKKGRRKGSKISKNTPETSTKIASTNEQTEEKKKQDDDIWADFMKDTGFQTRESRNSKSTKPNAPTQSRLSVKESPKTNSDVVKVTETFKFAGEEVTIEKEVRSSPGQGLHKSLQPPPGKRKGLGSILGQLGKKPKISTLEKSKLDWDKFKKDENIEEELSTHNKGKDGYLEKQDFLQRADLRRFEIEKELRTVERNKRMTNTT